MLNSKQERELVYLTKVDEVKPIPGRDRVECAVVGGWTCMVPVGAFKPGDIGVYFEIDSKCPAVEPFTFLEKRNYKIKTQKFALKDADGNKIGQFWSQGLLMPLSDFIIDEVTPQWLINIQKFSVDELLESDARFLTKELGVIYAEVEDNKRKGRGVDKYAKMAQRMGKKFSKQPYRWLMKYKLGRKILYLFFGRRSDKSVWPSHIAAKTDVERVQNMVWALNDKTPYVASEKVDGSSMSVMAERGKFGKIKQYVCSRNVVFEDPNQQCYYDRNIYFEAYKKYNLGEKIVKMLNDLNLPNIALQMEVYGPGVQKRDYSLPEGENRIALFHIISDKKKFPMDKVVELCEKYDIPHVPIIDDNYILPDTIDELQTFVEGEASRIDGKEKEGIVFYDKLTGERYFKFVSPSFLIKYH